MTETIYTQEVGKYHVQKTVGGWVVVFISDRNTARNVDGGKVHASRQNAYAKAKRLNDQQAQATEQWANMMLDEATDDMSEQHIDITPESLSKFFEENYELPFNPTEAQAWLEKQDWYK